MSPVASLTCFIEFVSPKVELVPHRRRFWGTPFFTQIWIQFYILCFNTTGEVVYSETNYSLKSLDVQNLFVLKQCKSVLPPIRSKWAGRWSASSVHKPSVITFKTRGSSISSHFGFCFNLIWFWTKKNCHHCSTYSLSQRSTNKIDLMLNSKGNSVHFASLHFMHF